MSVNPPLRQVVRYTRQSWPKQQPRTKKVKAPGKSRTLRMIRQRSGGLCERCGRPGHSTHHLLNQGQGGPWSPQNCVRLCGIDGRSGCHGWATTEPDAAWEEGFHVRPWETPGARPIHSKLHGVVLLADDGSVSPAPIEGAAS